MEPKKELTRAIPAEELLVRVHVLDRLVPRGRFPAGPEPRVGVSEESELTDR